MPFTPDAIFPAPPTGLAASYPFGSQLPEVPSYGDTGEWCLSTNSIYQSDGKQFTTFFWNSNFGVSSEVEIHKILIYTDGGVPSSWNYIDEANSPTLFNWSTQGFTGNPATPQDSWFSCCQVADKLFFAYFEATYGPDFPKLVMQAFDMTLGTWLPPVTSLIQSDVGSPNVYATPGPISIYNSVEGAIYVIANAITITGTDANPYIRPGYARFDPAGDAFIDTSWYQIADTTDIPNSYIIRGGCTTPDGTVRLIGDVISGSFDTFTGQAWYQAIYSGPTPSPVQYLTVSANPGVSGGLSVGSTIGRVLLTQSEIMFPFGYMDGLSDIPAIRVVRAPIPSGTDLPVWAYQQVVNLTQTGPGTSFGDYVLICDTGRLFLAYTFFVFFPAEVLTLRLAENTCFSTWALESSPSPGVELSFATVSGTLASPAVKYTFTGTVTPVGAQSIYALVQDSTCITIPPCGGKAFLPRFQRGPMPQ